MKCCFTSIETVGLFGTGAQDGHLDFRTAPELCMEVEEEGDYNNYTYGMRVITKYINSTRRGPRVSTTYIISTSDGVYAPCTYTWWSLCARVYVVEFMYLIFTRMPAESYRR